MKDKIIFTILFSIIFGGCKISQPIYEPQHEQPFELTLQYWFANPDMDSNFTDRGIDLTIFNQHYDFSLSPEYVIILERKSFPQMITPTYEDGYQIEDRIILESSRLQNSSERENQTNRIVFSNDDGEEVYIEFREWKTLPNRYEKTLLFVNRAQ